VHLLKNVKQPYIFIPGLTFKVKTATLYNAGKKIKFKQLPEGCFIYLDDVEQDNVDTIIQLEN
jgi:alpha-L-fucosidase